MVVFVKAYVVYVPDVKDEGFRKSVSQNCIPFDKLYDSGQFNEIREKGWISYVV